MPTWLPRKKMEYVRRPMIKYIGKSLPPLPNSVPNTITQTQVVSRGSISDHNTPK